MGGPPLFEHEGEADELMHGHPLDLRIPVVAHVVFVQRFSIKGCILERPKRAKIGNERFKSDPRETQERPRADQSDQRAIQEMPKSGQERFKSDPRVAKNKF